MNHTAIQNRLRALNMIEEDGTPTVTGEEKSTVVLTLIDEINAHDANEEQQAHSYFTQCLDLSNQAGRIITGEDRADVVNAHVQVLTKTWANDESQLSAILDIYQRSESNGTKTVNGANRTTLKTKLIQLL